MEKAAANWLKSEQIVKIVPCLLAWYPQHRRPFLWRENQEPYRVWVSEIMLQQTRIAAAIPYYERFMAALPTVEDLAAVPEERLYQLWEGLGYYSRARHLKQAAQKVMTDFGGRVPTGFEELLSLPGIGRYTAGAVASICGGECVPAVDGNVMRVLCRLLNAPIDATGAAEKASAERELKKVLPQDAPGLFNEAIMELGETICLPKGTIDCERCPLTELCKAKACGTQQGIPYRKPKPQKTEEEKTVLLLLHGSKVALCRRPDSGLLAGMWGFPLLDKKLSQKAIEKEYPHAVVCPLPRYTHVFTHKKWHMTGYKVIVSDREEAYQWVEREDLLAHYPMPTAFSRYRKELLKIKKI